MLAVHDPSLRRLPGPRLARLGRRRPARGSRAGPRRALPVPTSRADRRRRARDAGRHDGPGRPVRLRHDDPRRPGNVGGRGRRGHHRDRAGAGRGAGRLRLLPPAGPPRDADVLRGLLLPQQHGGRGGPPGPRRGRARRGARPRRAPRERDPDGVLRPRRRARRLGPRRPRRGLVSALPRLCGRDRGRPGPRRQPQPAASARRRRRGHARPRAGLERGRPRGRDLPGPDRRAGDDRGPAHRPAPSVHARAAVRRPRGRAHGGPDPDRRGARPDPDPARLSLPPALPARRLGRGRPAGDRGALPGRGPGVEPVPGATPGSGHLAACHAVAATGEPVLGRSL